MLATLEAAPVQEDPMLLAVPVINGRRVLDGYILGSKLGEGGMGAVYLGYHVELATRVAIKCLKTGQVGADEGLLRRFRNEAQLVASLNSPHLVRVNDARYSHGLHYLVLEYVDGETLTDRVERRGRGLPAAEACLIARLAARGLQAAHQDGTVHRDIKPPNIMVSRGGEVKIMDLGIARTSDARFTMVSSGDEVIGTPQYMAPEQFSAPSKVGVRTDVYALGATLFYMLTGRHAFEGESPAAVMHLVLGEGLAPGATWGVGLPASAVRIVARCMAREASDRYESMAALGADLEAAVQELGGGPALADEGIPAVEAPPEKDVVAGIRRVLAGRRAADGGGGAPVTIPEARNDQSGRWEERARATGLSKLLAGLALTSLLISGATGAWMVLRPEKQRPPVDPPLPTPAPKPGPKPAPGPGPKPVPDPATDPAPKPGPTPAEVAERRGQEGTKAAASGDWARVFELLKQSAAAGELESDEARRRATGWTEEFRRGVPKSERLKLVPRLMEVLEALVKARCGGAAMLTLEQITRYNERDRLQFEDLEQVSSLAGLAGAEGLAEAWRIEGEACASRHRPGASVGMLQRAFDAFERAEAAGAPDAAARLAALYEEFIAHPGAEPRQLAALPADQLRGRGAALAKAAADRHTPRGYYAYALYLNTGLIPGGYGKRDEYLRLAADAGYLLAQRMLDPANRR